MPESKLRNTRISDNMPTPKRRTVNPSYSLKQRIMQLASTKGMHIIYLDVENTEDFTWKVATLGDIEG